jgi:hypothetical protein
MGILPIAKILLFRKKRGVPLPLKRAAGKDDNWRKSAAFSYYRLDYRDPRGVVRACNYRAVGKGIAYYGSGSRFGLLHAVLVHIPDIARLDVFEAQLLAQPIEEIFVLGSG